MYCFDIFIICIVWISSWLLNQLKYNSFRRRWSNWFFYDFGMLFSIWTNITMIVFIDNSCAPWLLNEFMTDCWWRGPRIRWLLNHFRMFILLLLNSSNDQSAVWFLNVFMADACCLYNYLWLDQFRFFRVLRVSLFNFGLFAQMINNSIGGIFNCNRILSNGFSRPAARGISTNSAFSSWISR